MTLPTYPGKIPRTSPNPNTKKEIPKQNCLWRVLLVSSFRVCGWDLRVLDTTNHGKMVVPWQYTHYYIRCIWGCLLRVPSPRVPPFSLWTKETAKTHCCSEVTSPKTSLYLGLGKRQSTVNRTLSIGNKDLGRLQCLNANMMPLCIKLTDFWWNHQFPEKTNYVKIFLKFHAR